MSGASTPDASEPDPNFGALNPDAELYRVAYEQSVRALDDQRSEIDGMRQRVTAVMALIASASAFLIGAGLRAPDRHWPFWTVASFGTLATLLALALTFCMLRPSAWEGPLSGARLITSWIEPRPQPSYLEFLRQVTMDQETTRRVNELHLKTIRCLYQWTVAAGLLGLVVWSALVWAFA